MRQNHKNTRAASTVAIVLIAVLVGVVVGAVVVVAVLLSGFWPGIWAAGQIVGSGNLVTEEMEFSDFTVVDVGWAFKVDITQSDSYSVSITADDNVWDYIEASKTGETLAIGLQQGINFGWGSFTLRAEITMPDLYELYLSGATRGTAKGFSSSQRFIVGLSGASSLHMTDMSVGDVGIDLLGASMVNGYVMSGGDAQFELSGLSTLELEGSANDLRIGASGASNLDLSDFPVNDADVELSGASSATINLDGRLDADLSGASHLYYIGEPTMGVIETSGDSSVSPG